MGDTGIEKELVCPILKPVCLPAELIVKHEIVVWPLQALSDSSGKTIDLHELVVVENIEGKI